MMGVPVNDVIDTTIHCQCNKIPPCGATICPIQTSLFELVIGGASCDKIWSISVDDRDCPSVDDHSIDNTDGAPSRILDWHEVSRSRSGPPSGTHGRTREDPDQTDHLTIVIDHLLGANDGSDVLGSYRRLERNPDRLVRGRKDDLAALVGIWTDVDLIGRRRTNLVGWVGSRYGHYHVSK